MPTNALILLAFLIGCSKNKMPAPISDKPATAPSSSVPAPAAVSTPLTPAVSAPIAPSFGLPPDSQTTPSAGQTTAGGQVTTAASPTTSPPASPTPPEAKEVVKVVPAPAAPVQMAAAPPDANPPKSKKARTHRIAPGETLTGIARANGIAVEDLLRWNSLTWVDTYRSGQTITLEPITGGWRVRPGQNLSQIALVCHVGVDELASLNHLSADYVRSGTVLDIPSTVAVR